MALITTIAELKKYISIDDNAKMKSVQPYLNEAEQIVAALLGKEFYEEFLPLYAASVVDVSPTPLSAELAALLPYIQRPIAYYTLLKAIPHLTVTFGDMGIRQERSDESDAAPRWKEEKLLLNALINGDTHADKLLAFLEENATDSNDFATWFTSSANTKRSGLIVYSTVIASKHIEISNSRRVYLQLRDVIKQIEQRSVPKLISKEQYDEIVGQLQAGTVTPENELLVEKLEAIISKRALYMRLPFMRVSIGADGVWLYSDVNEIRSKDFLAAKEDIKVLRCELLDGEFGYVADEKDLAQFIIDNIDDYPLIAATPVYTTQPDPGPTWMPKNDENNKHMAV